MTKFIVALLCMCPRPQSIITKSNYRTLRASEIVYLEMEAYGDVDGDGVGDGPLNLKGLHSLIVYSRFHPFEIYCLFVLLLQHHPSSQPSTQPTVFSSCSPLIFPPGQNVSVDKLNMAYCCYC